MAVYMLIGLPRSGKTTWAKRYQKREGTPIVSADDIRHLVYGQRFWGEGEQLMWAIRSVILKSLLQQDIDVIIDETNTKRERRKPIIDLAKEYGHDVYGIVITTTDKECIKRAEQEGDKKIIPIIERMAAQYAEEPPSHEEGLKIITGVSGGAVSEHGYS